MTTTRESTIHVPMNGEATYRGHRIVRTPYGKRKSGLYTATCPWAGGAGINMAATAKGIMEEIDRHIVGVFRRCAKGVPNIDLPCCTGGAE